MTKQLFLRRLRVALWGWPSRRERKEIITDYDGFFLQGQAEQKSEDTIAVELGEPSAIIRNLAQESGMRIPSGSYLLQHSEQICLALGAFTFFIALLTYQYAKPFGIGNESLIILGMICYIVMCLSLYASCRHRLTDCNYRRGRVSLLAANGLLLTLAVSGCLFFNSSTSMNFTFWVMERHHPQAIRTAYRSIRAAYCLLASGLCAWALLGVWRGNSERFIIAIHAIGLFLYLETMYKLLHHMADVSLYWPQLIRTIPVYGLTLLVFGLVAFRLNSHKKRGRTR